LILTAQ